MNTWNRLSEVQSKENYLKSKQWEMWFEDGIFHYRCFPNTIFDLKASLLFFEERMSISEGKAPYPCFGDCRNVKYWSKESKQLAEKPDYIQLYTGASILIENHVQKILANFFLSFYKSAMPIAFFTDQEKALQWLQQYRYN